ncbi:MAG: hypothetical protein JXA14_17930 [Anaerolineae bacterium]|nr:hypothetical protein [Anaerolineae bacterium]
MDKILNYAFQSISLRLIVAALVVMLPVGISTTWLGAAYQHVMWEADFAQIVLGLMLFGSLAVFIVGYVVLYPLERWVIRDRATDSWKWIAVRILLYTLAGIPIGLALQWGVRLGVRTYPALVESSYFVITVTNVGIVGIIYTFFERALVEMQKREEALQKTIQELRIEIDEARRAEKVQEIAETDYFRDLQNKAEEMRERRRK